MAIDKVTSAALETSTNQPGFRNAIINGDMSIAQRGQQTGLATGYTECDRFALYNSGTSVQFTTDQDTSVPSGQNFSSSLKLTLTTADSSIAASDEVQLYQNIEAQNLQYLGFGTSSAKPLVLSFYVKSSVAGNYVLWIYKADTTGRQIAKLYNIASADTWQKVTFEIPADTDSGATIENDNGTGLSIVWQLAAGTNFTSGTLATSWEDLVNANRYAGLSNTFIGTTNATFFLTGVQLEAGTSASDFEFLPVDVNKNRCFRYFQDLAPKKNDCRIAIGENVSGTRSDPILQYVEKRADPSVTFTAANTFSLYNAASSRDCSSISADNFSKISGNLNANVSSGLTPTGGASQFITNGTGSQIFVDAEL